MVAVTEQQEEQTGVEGTSSDEACTSLSIMLTNTSEYKDSLKKKRMEIAELRGELKAATDVEEALENVVQNMEVQIQEIQNTCTDFVPRDCCQVYTSHSPKLKDVGELRMLLLLYALIPCIAAYILPLFL